MSNPPTPADHVLVGKIVGAHGLKGNIKIISFAESLDLFEKGSAIVLREPDGRPKEHIINWIKPHGRTVLLSLAGITGRDRVEALVGCELYIEKARLPRLQPGVFYWSELIGLDVVTTGGRYLGKLDSIIQTGSNDVYVVRDQQRETLIPALENVVIAVDIVSGEMQVDLPEGL